MLSGVKSAVVRSLLIFTMLFVVSCAGTRKTNYPPTEQRMIAKIDSLVAACNRKDKLLKKCSDIVDELLKNP